MPLELIRKDIDQKDRLKQAAMQLWDEFELRTQVQMSRLRLQDAWLLTYLLVDMSQNSGPDTRERYWSPRPANIVDTAKRVLARNPIKYHVTGRHLASSNSQTPEFGQIRVLENVLHGLQYDADRQLAARGELSARQQAAFHSLVRGAWSFKLHLTKNAGTSTGSPAFYEQYDPRQVLPVWDKSGLESVVAFNVTTFAKEYYRYPKELQQVFDAIRAITRRSASGAQAVDWSWLHVPLQILEWSSRKEHALLLDLSGLPDWATGPLGASKEMRDWYGRRFIWLQEPYQHGFGESLIRYGHVNGIPIGLIDKQAVDSYYNSALLKLPIQGVPAQFGSQAQPLLYLNNGQRSWYGSSQNVDPAGALAGRSIFANVAHLFPELNKLIAVLKQAIISEVRGTWTLTTRNGQMVNLELGTGAVNPLQFGEGLQKVQAGIQAPDAMALLQTISQEISDGSIDLRFILASEGEATGALRARLEQAALISTEDYKDGMQAWAVDLAETFMKQYRAAGKGTFKDWTLMGREGQEQSRFFVVDVDEQVDELLHAGKEPPVIEATVKVAMPVDMVARINMAKVAIDPSNPIMSLRMAMDIIMEFDDPQAAEEMLLQDVGNRNPSIQLLRIANAFSEAGAPEIAQMILQDNFRSAFANQQTNQQGASVTGPSGAPRGVSSNTAPPELTSGGQTEQGAPAGRTTAPARMQ